MRLLQSASFVLLSAGLSQALPADYPDLKARIPLNAFKSIPKELRGAGSFAGHPMPRDMLLMPTELLKLVKAEASIALEEAELLTKPVTPATFDAAAQLINVTGEHAFIPPDFENGDVRGLCPGLNVLANHGYLPRNGVASFQDYIEVPNKIFGMGHLTTTLLSVWGTIWGGNPLSLTPGFSQAGPSDAPEAQNILGNLGGLLSKPGGLSNTHNIFEVDGSPTRADRYSGVNGGNVNDMYMPYFMDLYNLQKDAEEPNYSLDVLFEHANNRWHQAIATNPYFVAAPFTSIVVRDAPYAFTARLMANRSAEHPEDGILDKETLKSFFAVYGPEGNMTYKVGWERIPDNWYRRYDTYPFIGGMIKDILTYATTKYPMLLAIGGNTGTPNSFVGLDIEDVTGGVLNAATLLEGNNLLCFAMEYLRFATPSILTTFYATISPLIEVVTTLVDNTMLSVACPAFKDLSVGGTDLFQYFIDTFPGANMSGGAI